MKTSIVIVITFGFLAVGCGSTTYLNLKENSRDQIENKINEYEQEENEGAEITLSLQNGKEINGELLSIRESSLTICTEYSAKEEELAGLKYPMNVVQNDEIKELTIEGGWYIWSGMGYGALGGAALGAITFAIGFQNNTHITEGTAAIVGGVLGAVGGAIVGGIIGATSYDKIVLQDIPPGYKFLPLKNLARYPDKEPEYLKAIK